MVRIHVPENPWSRLRKRIDLGGEIVLGADPSHDTEASHVVNIERLQAIEAEVLEVHP